MRKDQFTVVYSAGGRGNTVAVCRRAKSDNLFLRWWDQKSKRRRYRSLGHNDDERAREAADTLAREFLDLTKKPGASLAHIFTRYEQERTPRKSEAQQKADRRRMDMWQEHLTDIDPETIDRATIDQFVEDRRAGRIPGFRPVRGRQVQIDVGWLRTVFRWAASPHGPRGGRLIAANPLEGYTNPAMGEPNPRRPVASWEQFLGVYRYADRVDSQKLLKFLLLLVEPLGWRVSALCQLRASDFDLAKRPGAPYGRVRKRPETDKERVDQWVPLSRDARKAVDRLIKKRAVLGRRYLFPSPRDQNKPWTKDHAQKLHRRAQYLAGAGHRLEHGAHGECLRCGESVDARDKHWYKLYSACEAAPYVGWHAYRRKWVTERKHLPRKDVAYAGGWRSMKTLDLYEHVDDETVFEVVSTPRKLRESLPEKGAM